MRILGIDPGLANTGWGIVDFDSVRFSVFSYGVITTDPADRVEMRIACIAEKIKNLARENIVQHASIEDIFFAKNEVSAMNVAKVIGALCHAMFCENIGVTTFTPLQIKMAITGNGRAEKNQVQEMCRLLLKMQKIPKPDHAADALAVAICYANVSSTYNKLGIKENFK